MAGIGIYTDADPDAEISQSGVFTNPLSMTLDGRSGEVLVQKLYVRNNNSEVSYSGISVTPVDTAGTDLIGGESNGYSWKLIHSSLQPSEEDWEDVSAPNTVTFPDVLGTSSEADVNTYLPFWVRVEVPRNQSIQTITDIILKINATEIIVS